MAGALVACPGAKPRQPGSSAITAPVRHQAAWPGSKEREIQGLTCAAVGRLAGSLTRHLDTSSRIALLKCFLLVSEGMAGRGSGWWLSQRRSSGTTLHCLAEALLACRLPVNRQPTRGRQCLQPSWDMGTAGLTHACQPALPGPRAPKAAAGSAPCNPTQGAHLTPAWAAGSGWSSAAPAAAGQRGKQLGSAGQQVLPDAGD